MKTPFIPKNNYEFCQLLTVEFMMSEESHLRVIETNTQSITNRLEYLVFETKKNTFHEIKDAKENINAGKNFISTSPLPALMDIRQLRGLSDTACEYYLGEESKKIISKAALLVDSPSSSYIAKIFEKKSKLPIKIFTNQDEAIEWLLKPLEETFAGKFISNEFVFANIFISMIPFFLSLLGFELGFNHPPLSSHQDDLAMNTALELMNGSVAYFLLESLGFSLCLMTFLLTYLGSKHYRDHLISLVGLAMLFTGLSDIYHSFSALHSINTGPMQDMFHSLNWTNTRFINAILLTAVCIASSSKFLGLHKKNVYEHLNPKFAFLGLSIMVAFMYSNLPFTLFPETYNPNKIISRPWDIVPLAVYIYVAYLSYSYYKKSNSIMAFAVFISCIPNLIMQAHMAFGSKEMFDTHFIFSHLLKIQAYFVICFSIIKNYTETIHALHISSEDLHRTQLSLEVINEAINEASLVSETDCRGNIIYVNKKFCEISKFSKKELLGANHRLLKSNEHTQDFYRNLWETIKSGHVWKHEIQNKAEDGSLFWAATTIYPYQNSKGEIEKFVSIQFDITKKKNLEKELKSEKLKATESSKAKSEFLANMSHEIRTPMNGVLGNAELLKDSGHLSEKQEKFVENILDSGTSMMEILNDILDFSKIESGKMELDSHVFDLHKLIQSLLNFHDTQASSKGLFLIYKQTEELPRFILSDSTRLRQIISNLISNAIKFTHKGGITLEAGSLKYNNGYYTLKFSVVDTGVGIPEEKIQKIFHSFSQADSSTTRNFGGTGLGLTISKRLTHLFGGQIWVENDLIGGAIFSFTITCKKPSKEDIANISKEHHSIAVNESQLKILLVEDNQMNSELACAYLESFNIFPDIAKNGQEALDFVKNNQYDLVLMDCQMPIMDGYTATAKIRKSTNIQQPVIIALTANAMKGDKDRCLDAGMDDYLTKPLSKKKLSKSIEKWSYKIQHKKI